MSEDAERVKKRRAEAATRALAERVLRAVGVSALAAF